MFAFLGVADFMRVGERNIEAAKKALEKEKVPLLAEDVGGNYGRSIELSTATGKLRIRTIGHGEKVL